MGEVVGGQVEIISSEAGGDFHRGTTDHRYGVVSESFSLGQIFAPREDDLRTLNKFITSIHILLYRSDSFFRSKLYA